MIIQLEIYNDQNKDSQLAPKSAVLLIYILIINILSARKFRAGIFLGIRQNTLANPSNVILLIDLFIFCDIKIIRLNH